MSDFFRVLAPDLLVDLIDGDCPELWEWVLDDIETSGPKPSRFPFPAGEIRYVEGPIFRW